MENIDTASVEHFLQRFLPKSASKSPIWVTATWAQSLDGRIAAGPGMRTHLSGLYTKKMTHYIRTHHDAILVGRQTVAADNPRLNCRYAPNCASPQPIILDSQLKWEISLENWRNWQVLNNAAQKLAKAPWVVVNRTSVNEEKRHIIEDLCFGKVIAVENTKCWSELCTKLAELGVKSLMVEGGAQVLSSCFAENIPDSVIVTVAPVFLGKNGVDAAPVLPYKLSNSQWWTAPDVPDSVLAGELANYE